jgi:MFS transporter, FSR family, fosmidomycin resistance protein
MQALLAAIYPMLKSGFALSFGQIGVLTLIFRVTVSLLQPMGGLYTDRRPQPYSLPLGMACSLIGMVTLAKHLMYWSASKDHRSGPIDLHSPP